MRKVADPDDYRDRFARAEGFECLKWAWHEIPEVRSSFGGWVPWVQSIRGEKRHAHRRDQARAIALRHGIQITFDHKGTANFTRPGRQP